MVVAVAAMPATAVSADTETSEMAQAEELHQREMLDTEGGTTTAVSSAMAGERAEAASILARTVEKERGTSLEKAMAARSVDTPTLRPKLG